MSVFTPERHLRACVQEPARRGVWGCLGSGAYVLPIPALLCFLLHSNLGLGGVLGIDDLRDAEGGGWGGGGPLSPGARVFWCHFSRPVSWDSRLLGHWAPDGASGRTGEAGPGPVLVSLLWNPPPQTEDLGLLASRVPPAEAALSWVWNPAPAGFSGATPRPQERKTPGLQFAASHKAGYRPRS